MPSEPSPSAWSEAARCLRARVTSRDFHAVVAALDAAEQRGFDRAVNETAIASIHKAVAAERAAVVAELRADLDRLLSTMGDRNVGELTAALAQGAREALAAKADKIERGEHREENDRG